MDDAILTEDEREKLEARLVHLFSKATLGTFGWKWDSIPFKPGALTEAEASELSSILRHKQLGWDDYYDCRSSTPDGAYSFSFTPGGMGKLKRLLEEHGREAIAKEVVPSECMIGEAGYEGGDFMGIKAADLGAAVDLNQTVIGQTLSKSYDIPNSLSPDAVLQVLEKHTKVEWENTTLETEHGELPCYRTRSIQAAPKEAKREIETALGKTILLLDDGYVTIPHRVVTATNFGSLAEFSFTSFADRNTPPPAKGRRR